MKNNNSYYIFIAYLMMAFCSLVGNIDVQVINALSVGSFFLSLSELFFMLERAKKEKNVFADFLRLQQQEDYMPVEYVKKIYENRFGTSNSKHSALFYITQVVRMFDKDSHKEYVFLGYLIGLIPPDPIDMIDIEGKLKLEYYKLQKTFEGSIELDFMDGVYVPAKAKSAMGKMQKTPLDEIIEKVNEKYKGQFVEGDRVMIDALHERLKKNQKLASSAKTVDPKIFVESIFPAIFENAALDSYTESQESYSALFEDRSKYDAVKGALAGVLYRELRENIYV